MDTGIMWSGEEFGMTKAGDKITRYTASTPRGMHVSVITYGASIASIRIPAQDGSIEDIVAGYSDIAGFESGQQYYGAVMGRFTNRIGNASFDIDDQEYKLYRNDGPNSLHGGREGFHRKVWTSEVDGASLKMRYTSHDLEEGYPGELKVTVCYQLLEDNTLYIEYMATTSRPTVVNLTNHAGYNLGGHKSSTIRDHRVMINADRFTPKDEHNIPTGDLADVTGTLYDLRKPVLLGDRLDLVPGGMGYDHNFCVNGNGDKKLVARVEHAGSGRTMEVYSNQAGVQLYTGYFINGELGKDDASYQQWSSLSIETQNYPDAPNKPNFPPCLLRPGETYRHLAWFKFGVNSSN